MKIKTVLGTLTLAFGLALFLVFISSAIPIRWDYKSLAPNLLSTAETNCTDQLDS